MTRLEILASYLDQEPGENEKKNQQQNFKDNLEFISLCIEAKYLLLEQNKKKGSK